MKSATTASTAMPQPAMAIRAVPGRQLDQLPIVGHELVQAVLDVEAAGDAGPEQVAPGRREPAALSGDADQRGRRAEAQGVLDRPDDRDPPVLVLGALRVENGHHRVAAVVNDAAGSLPVVGIARATLSEDQEPFVAPA